MTIFTKITRALAYACLALVGLSLTAATEAGFLVAVLAASIAVGLLVEVDYERKNERV